MLSRFRRITADTWFALGLEFFAIVLGVLFALTLDECREERQIAEMNAIAVDRLNEEIRRNYEEIRRNVAIVEERYARIAALSADVSRPFSESVPLFSAYSHPELKNSVWERMGHDTLANRIDPMYIDGATELYNQNRLLEQLSAEIFRFGVSETAHDPAQAPLALNVSKSIMLQQIQLQHAALARYEDFISRFMPTSRAR
jgi:hypothetical protein